MPNHFKYSTASETSALKSGNFYIATGDVDKGPTNITGYYNGITPPTGGYTIYLNKATDGPSIYVANNDSQLISLTNTIAGATFTTVTECLIYYAGQLDKVCLNREYETIVTRGLIFSLDAGFDPSYPRTQSTWYDLIGNNNGTLGNGATYSSSNGGSIVLDGIDDIISFNDNNLFRLSGPNTVSFWCRYESNSIECVRSTGELWSIAITANRSVNFEMHPGGSISDTPFTLSEAELPLNTWGMLTCVGTTNSCDGYWNGVYRGSIPFPFPPENNYTGTGSFSINGRGSIGSLMIYNRSLTPAEVLQNFNAQIVRFGTALVNTVAPVISGDNFVSRTLTSTTGTWTGTAPISYSYQWQRSTNGGVTYSNISGATGSTYSIQAADASFVVRCTISATNALGSQTANSNTITIASTILDMYPTNVALAYYLELERGAYYGSPLINVRRSSDSAAQDIGHTADGQLDVAALSTFVGGTNRIVRSQELHTTPWANINTTTVATNSVAPDGTNTAYTFQLSAAFGTLQQSWQSSSLLPNPSTSSIWNMSVHVKKVNRATIRLADSSLTKIYIFNYDNPGASTGPGTFSTLSNGWFRISMTFSGAEIVNGMRLQGANDSASGDQHIAWGAQVAPGTASSLIPGTYAVSRSSIAGTGYITTWYDQSTNARHASQTSASFQEFIMIDSATFSIGSQLASRKIEQGSPLIRQGNYTYATFSTTSITTYKKHRREGSGNRTLLGGALSNSLWQGYIYAHNSQGQGIRDPGTYNNMISWPVDEVITSIHIKQGIFSGGITASGNVHNRRATGTYSLGTLKTDLVQGTVSFISLHPEFFNTWNTENFRGIIAYTAAHTQSTIYEAIANLT